MDRILAERILKLAVPNLYCWLLMFFTLFHTWLSRRASGIGLVISLFRYSGRIDQIWWPRVLPRLVELSELQRILAEMESSCTTKYWIEIQQHSTGSLFHTSSYVRSTEEIGVFTGCCWNAVFRKYLVMLAVLFVIAQVFSGVLHEYVSMIPFGLPFYTLVTQGFIAQVRSCYYRCYCGLSAVLEEYMFGSLSWAQDFLH